MLGAKQTFSPLGLFFRSLFERVAARFAIYYRRVVRFFMLRGDRSGKRILARFGTLLPEIGHYKDNVVLRLLCVRARSKGFMDLERYYELVNSDPVELSALRDHLTFVRTSFFRGGMWQELGVLCGERFGSNNGKIRVWSAGCSSGMEVYSLLIMLLEHFPGDRIDILATDRNERMLRLCRKGVYPILSIRDIPRRYWNNLEINGKRFRVSNRLRKLVRTRSHDLLTDDYPGGFDVILCRNVIKFFKEDSDRRKVQHDLVRSLNPGGLLMLSDEMEKEGIADPGSLQLSRIGNSCVYQKLG